MLNLKGTRTEKNLMEAFAGESQARNRYSYFAEKAREEGHTALADTLEDIAINEREHAKKWFKILRGGAIPTTVDNLKSAIEGENAEWTDMYPRMAAEAREEGFNVIASFFDSIGNIEKRHSANLRDILSKFEGELSGEAGDRPETTEKTIWLCRFCGFVVDSENEPKVCSVCEQEKAFFQQSATVYVGDE